MTIHKLYHRKEDMFDIPLFVYLAI